MRITEHFTETPPRPRVQVIEPDSATPSVVVEIRTREFGPIIALHAENPQQLDVLIEALTGASIALVAAQARAAVRALRSCTNCGDVTDYLSSRDWCDGCEAAEARVLTA